MEACQHCGHRDLYATPTRAILCGWCGRKQDRLTYTDDQLLSMEWPEYDGYQSAGQFNEEHGRDLTSEEYGRLRTLTGMPAGVIRQPVTSKTATMAGVARLLGG